MQLPGLLLPDLVTWYAQLEAGPMGPTWDRGTDLQGRLRLGAKRVSMVGGGGESLTVVAAGTCQLTQQVAVGDQLGFAGTRYTVLACTPKRPPVGGPAGAVAAWWEAVLQ